MTVLNPLKHGRYVLIASFILTITSCERYKSPQQLAERHCSTCHAFVPPDRLNKKSWEKGVLPEMAFRMGLDVSKLSTLGEADLDVVLRTLPAKAMVSEEQWKLITAYYLKHAPDTLSSQLRTEPIGLTQFSPSATRLNVQSNTSLTMVEYNEGTEEYFIGSRRGKLYKFSPTFTLEDSFDLGSPPSKIRFEDLGRIQVLCMGIMNPNEQAAGSIIRLILSEGKFESILDSLQRPVHFEEADLNNDGEKDLLVSSFGNFTGDLAAFEKIDFDYKRHVIHNFPGTRKTIVRDMNGDGLQDILALVTQGDEHIALFTNRGNFRFAYRVLLKFSPVNGSSYFELCDMNKDGNPDILYTNGDNADYSTILKPYHGVRLFLNDGRNHFEESWFYPMHGASMARAEDFDEDGDIDIAVISFFPDFKNHPEHGFIYLENVNGEFTPYSTLLASVGRWITMESSDIDDDGDKDILLAALNFPDRVPHGLVKQWQEHPVSLLVLRNNKR